MDNYIPGLKNGRVINITEKPIERFPLFANNCPNDEFTNKALFGIQDCTPLSRAFFSKENIKLLQDMLRYNVYIKSNKKLIIGPQSTIEMEIISRAMFLQNARFLNYNIKEQIKELNSLIINKITPMVISETLQYQGFLLNLETLPVPIEHPKNLSSAGTRLLRSITTTF